MSKSHKNTGLGRGLSALLGEQQVGAETASAQVRNLAQDNKIAIDLLQRNPEQPRRSFARADMDRLIASVQEKGVLQPILARPLGETGKYQIIAGERRWRAAQAAGLHEVPVHVMNLSDAQVMEVALIENIQRADLNPLEEAEGYAALIRQYGHTQDKVAKALGRSRAHIANMMRLLELPSEIKELVVTGGLSAGHGRALLGAPDAVQLANLIMAQGLSVRATEKLVKRVKAAPETKNATRAQMEKSTDVRALEDQLAQNLGLHVEIKEKGASKGELRIQYRDLEQLDDLVRRLNS